MSELMVACRMRGLAAVALLLSAGCPAVESLPPPPSLQSDDDERAPQLGDIGDDPACKLFVWPLPPERAALILKSTKIFADTGIYFAGEPPPQVAAFNVLLDQPDPLAWFSEIAQNGGVAGRLYALCAFQLLDHAYASHLGQKLKSTMGQVFTQFGCIGSDDTVANVAKNILEHSTGRFFREARDRTFAYYDQPDNLCEPLR